MSAAISISGTKYVLVHPCCHTFSPKIPCHDLRKSRKKRGGRKEKETKATNRSWCSLKQNKWDWAKAYCHTKYLLFFSYDLARMCLPPPWCISCPRQILLTSIWEKILTVICNKEKKWDCALLLFVVGTKSLEMYALKTQILNNSLVSSSNPFRGWKELNHGQHAWPQALSL